jgi:hypothetical protein
MSNRAIHTTTTFKRAKSVKITFDSNRKEVHTVDTSTYEDDSAVEAWVWFRKNAGLDPFCCCFTKAFPELDKEHYKSAFNPEYVNEPNREETIYEQEYQSGTNWDSDMDHSRDISGAKPQRTTDSWKKVEGLEGVMQEYIYGKPRKKGVKRVYCLTCKLFMDESEGSVHQQRLITHLVVSEVGYQHSDCKISCSCGGGEKYRDIDLILEEGLKCVSVSVCNCASAIDILLDNHLWPVSPVSPRSCFSFSLLESFYSIHLATKCSIQRLIEILKVRWRCNGILPKSWNLKFSNLYKKSRESIRQFFYYYHTQQVNLDGCHSCLKSQSPVYSVDACFQLRRKKSAGTPHRSPLFSNSRFFVDKLPDKQNYVNPAKTCHHRAGDLAQKSQKFDGLDISGVMGSVCAHDIPSKFIPITNGDGEKYIYAASLIKAFGGDASKIRFMYDINCTFKPWLERNYKELTCETYAIPVFHAYGHNFQCQLRFNPRNIEGFGLTDGEGCERLWSYLSPLCNQLKESRKSVFIDTLELHLSHFSTTKNLDLGASISRNLKKMKVLLCDIDLKLKLLLNENEGLEDAANKLTGYLEEKFADLYTNDTALMVLFNAVSAYHSLTMNFWKKNGTKRTTLLAKKRQNLLSAIKEQLEKMNITDLDTKDVLSFQNAFWKERLINAPDEVIEYQNLCNMKRCTKEGIDMAKKDLENLQQGLMDLIQYIDDHKVELQPLLKRVKYKLILSSIADTDSTARDVDSNSDIGDDSESDSSDQ